MLSFLAGLAAGAAHVVTGPDHWVAVTPLSIAQPQRALRVGVRWGLGHAVGILFLGALGLYLRDLLSLDHISSFAEGMVGVVLVISGLWALRRSSALVIHSHPHDHDHKNHDREDHDHAHVHLHVGDASHDSEDAHRAHIHAAFGFGMLHGVAGASQLWALIPTLALPTEAAIGYLGGVLISSVITMGGFTYAVGRWVQLEHISLDRAFKVIGWGSIVLGIYWASPAMFAA